MSIMHNAQRIVAAAAGLGLGFLICLGTTAAKESSTSPVEVGAPAFNKLEFKLASAAQFEMPQVKALTLAVEPFGLGTSAPVNGRLQQKWAGVKKKLPHEASELSRCRARAEACTPAARRFLAVIEKASGREGWTRVAEINRAINLSIKAIDDMTQYGVRDLWASPLMTFAAGAGDCEDLAIAKYVALHEIGVSDDDLRLVIVRDHAANEDHAVTAIRYDGRWLILDNKKLDIREDVSIAGFNPLFVIDGDGIKRAEAPTLKPQHPWTDASLMTGQQFSSAEAA